MLNLQPMSQNPACKALKPGPPNVLIFFKKEKICNLNYVRNPSVLKQMVNMLISSNCAMFCVTHTPLEF